MSISSDVFITKEKAKDMVKRKLMFEQEKLVTLAVESMDDWELTRHLNYDGSIYYYNIEEEVNK